MHEQTESSESPSSTRRFAKRTWNQLNSTSSWGHQSHATERVKKILAMEKIAKLPSLLDVLEDEEGVDIEKGLKGWKKGLHKKKEDTTSRTRKQQRKKRRTSTESPRSKSKRKNKTTQEVARPHQNTGDEMEVEVSSQKIDTVTQDIPAEASLPPTDVTETDTEDDAAAMSKACHEVANYKSVERERKDENDTKEEVQPVTLPRPDPGEGVVGKRKDFIECPDASSLPSSDVENETSFASSSIPNRRSQNLSPSTCTDRQVPSVVREEQDDLFAEIDRNSLPSLFPHDSTLLDLLNNSQDEGKEIFNYEDVDLEVPNIDPLSPPPSPFRPVQTVPATPPSSNPTVQYPSDARHKSTTPMYTHWPNQQTPPYPAPPLNPALIKPLSQLKTVSVSHPLNPSVISKYAATPELTFGKLRDALAKTWRFDPNNLHIASSCGQGSYVWPLNAVVCYCSPESHISFYALLVNLKQTASNHSNVHKKE